MNAKKAKSPLSKATWNWKKETLVFICALAAVVVVLSFGRLLAGEQEHKFTLLEKIEERILFAVCWPTRISESFIYFHLFLPERLALLWTPLSILSVFLSGLFWTAMVELCFKIKKWLPAGAAFGLFIFIIGTSFFVTRNWDPPSNFSSMSACVNNLRVIDSAKNQWALEHGKTGNDTPNWVDILPYMGREATNKIPECPDGGQYTIGKIAENPKCSIGGEHLLP